MNRQKQFLIIISITIFIIGIALILLMLRGEKETQPLADPLPVIEESDPVQVMAQSDAEVQDEEPELASDPEPVRDISQVPEEMRKRIPTYFEIEELLKTQTPAEVYDSGDKFTRMALVQYLSANIELNENILELLAMETDSYLRSQLFIHYKNPDRFMPPTPGKTFRDSTLEQALNMPMQSNIEPDEYLARVKISMVTSLDLAMEQSRLAKQAWPDDERIRYVAAETMLRANQINDALSSAEKREAIEIVLEELNRLPHESDVTPSERINGFSALADWGTPDERRQFYREQLAMESDPRAIDILIRLIENIETGNS